MKKIISMILALTLMFVLTGCGVADVVECDLPHAPTITVGEPNPSTPMIEIEGVFKVGDRIELLEDTSYAKAGSVGLIVAQPNFTVWRIQFESGDFITSSDNIWAVAQNRDMRFIERTLIKEPIELPNTTVTVNNSTSTVTVNGITVVRINDVRMFSEDEVLDIVDYMMYMIAHASQEEDFVGYYEDEIWSTSETDETYTLEEILEDILEYGVY